MTKIFSHNNIKRALYTKVWL